MVLKGSKTLYISLFFASLISLSACTTNTSNSNVQKPQNMAMANAMDLKPWNEAYRLPEQEQQKYVDNLATIFPGVIFDKGPTQPQRVALTFDDGPDNYYTPKILSILHERGVPATFFMIGTQVQKFPDLAKRIVIEGHDIGNHSWAHPRFPKLSPQNVIMQIQSTETEIRHVTGKSTDLFRPPFGLLTQKDIKQIQTIGYRVIDWTVDAEDWKGSKREDVFKHVSHDVSSGAIIALHCRAGKPGELDGTVEALPQIIDYLHGLGYQFVTIHTLLGK